LPARGDLAAAWYLRKFTRVGYWTASEQVEALEPAEIIIMSNSEAGKRPQSELDSYFSQYFSLRPDVLMVLAIREDLWEIIACEKPFLRQPDRNEFCRRAGYFINSVL